MNYAARLACLQLFGPNELASAHMHGGRAALLIGNFQSAAPKNIYEGSVDWRVTTTPAAGGPKPKTVLHALIDIPQESIEMSFDMEKNDDSASYAPTYFITLVFADGHNSLSSRIKQVATPQLRYQSSPAGLPMSGKVERITSNSFLVGLSGKIGGETWLGPSEWFDIPLALNDNRSAKLTFEKGPSGEKALREAFSAWGVGIERPKSPGAPYIASPAAEEYRKTIYERVRARWNLVSGRFDKSASAVVLFAVDDHGKLASIGLSRTGGSIDFDLAAMRAVSNAAPFPAPEPTFAHVFAAELKGESKVRNARGVWLAPASINAPVGADMRPRGSGLSVLNPKSAGVNQKP